jgi:phage terminase large subunit
MLDKTSPSLLNNPSQAAIAAATTDDWWPPNYGHKYLERALTLSYLAGDVRRIAALKAHYASGVEGCIAFIEDWVDTFDPRNVGKPGKLATMPLIMFPRQHELVRFLFALIEQEANGLIEKSRDMGATWVCSAVSVWFLLFRKGTSIGWGSRKAILVDRIGDMDSIFEKMRFIIRSLPAFLLPVGWNEDNMGSMKIVNPAMDAAITGESGDDIGRGGRKLIYFKDESAHYEHPEAIEAALGENTRCQIDISSVNGTGNPFHIARENGQLWEVGKPMRRDCVNVFIMDWRDHPEKNQKWYEERRAFYASKGIPHKFAQEIDRNYTASIEGIIIPYEWVQSALDADKKLGRKFDEGGWGAALDVADGGEGVNDKNALVKRKGSKLMFADEWHERDTGMTARRCIASIEGNVPITIQYDCIGVGAGVKAEINRLDQDEHILPKGVSFVPWDAGAKVLWPEKRVIEDDREAPTWEDFAQNLKAQGWWLLRRRFENTHKAVTEGVHFDIDEMVCISSMLPKATLDQLMKEIAQPTKGLSARLKLIVNKTPKGTRSPNLGDATMMCFHPAVAYMYDSSMSWVG